MLQSRRLFLLPLVAAIWSSAQAELAAADTAASHAAALAAAGVYGEPQVKSWIPAAVPAGVDFRRGQTAVVTVRAVIAADGSVTGPHVLDSTDPRLDRAAVANLQQWRFSPALADGKPVPMCMDVPVVFDPASRGKAALLPPEPAKPSPRTEAQPKDHPEADYPEELQARKMEARVELTGEIDAEGHFLHLAVSRATDGAFVPAALAAFRHWTFEPAKQGDLPVSGPVKAEMDFSTGDVPRGERLAANHIAAPDGSPAANPPAIFAAPAPVTPYAMIAAGKAGEAVVTFTATDEGRVDEVKVASESEPGFGLALAAAVESWYFRPAVTDDGHYVAVPLAVKWTFEAGTDAALPDLVAADKAGKIAGAAGLDHRLTPLYRKSPGYPQALRGQAQAAGQATLDAVVCRDGRVRLIRAVSASAPEFAAAAAQSLSEWLFEPPTRQGQPVDVRVRVPFRFAAQ